MLDTVKINHVQHISFTQPRLTDAVSVILRELLSYEHPSKGGGRFCPVQRVRRHITRSPWVSRSPVKRKPKDSYSAAAGRLASTTLR